MAKRPVWHVTHTDEGWKVKKVGAEKAAGIFDEKEKAVKAGIEIAKNQPLAQLVIHKMNNKIQEERTYGEDPYPPKG